MKLIVWISFFATFQLAGMMEFFQQVALAEHEVKMEKEARKKKQLNNAPSQSNTTPLLQIKEKKGRKKKQGCLSCFK